MLCVVAYVQSLIIVALFELLSVLNQNVAKQYRKYKDEVMRNKSLVLILCLTGSLLGCSSKPSENEIAAELSAFWGSCGKVSDVNKTNGVEGDGGKIYQVAFTYKLEINEDGSSSFGVPSSCSKEGGTNSQAGVLTDIVVSNAISGKNGPLKPIKKGDTYTVSQELISMIKSDNGWIFAK